MYLSTVNGKGGISAKVVAASVANSIPIHTLELRYPRFIHAQCKTHRVFSLDDEQYELVLKQSVDFMDDPMLSRNASSSRAIPVEKSIDAVEHYAARPIFWGSAQAGMQAGYELEERYRRRCQVEWFDVRDRVVQAADFMRHHDLHKQVVNRLLEPFSFITVVVTATEWDNFFALRLDDAAQPEIQELARCMKEAMTLVEPTKLLPGEWHLPYVDVQLEDDDKQSYRHNMPITNYPTGGGTMFITKEEAIKCSVARCARVSYLNHDKTEPDVEKDLALADRLLEAGHMSPFEHQATPMKEHYWCDDEQVLLNDIAGVTHYDTRGYAWSSNFRGWIQCRHTL